MTYGASARILGVTDMTVANAVRWASARKDDA